MPKQHKETIPHVFRKDQLIRNKWRIVDCVGVGAYGISFLASLTSFFFLIFIFIVFFIFIHSLSLSTFKNHFFLFYTGEIYSAKNEETGNLVAIKIEEVNAAKPSLECEVGVLKLLKGIPSFFINISINHFFFIVLSSFPFFSLFFF